MLFTPKSDLFWYAPDGASGSGGASGTGGSGSSNNGGGTAVDSGNSGGSGDQGDAKEPVTYEAWFGSLPEENQRLVEEHTKSLKGALQSERQAAKDLEKQVRALSSKAEKGSEMEQQLTALADQLSSSELRTNFYEDAHTAGVTNLKLAFVLATQEGLFDKRGNVDFTAMKRDYPELFGRVSQSASRRVAGNAGEGSGTDNQPSSAGMNNFIRAASGRRISN